MAWVRSLDATVAQSLKGTDLQTRFSEDSGMFSPDGRWVAYTSNESGRPEIYVAAFPGAGGK